MDDPVNRIFFTLLLLLLLITGGVLTWQWNVFSDKTSDSNSSTYKASETIRMTITNQNIEINHEISGLPAGSYSLQNLKSKQISCQENKKDCMISGKGQIKANGGNIQLTYSLKKSKASAYVLNKWAIELQGVKMSKTRVEITHYGKNTGIWAASAHIVGQTKKENISYFVFEGNEGIFPLYFQNKELKKVEYKGFMVYGDSSKTVIQAAKRYEVKTPFTFIITNKISSFTSKYLLIRPSKGHIVDVLSGRYYHTNYHFKNKKEKWLQSLIGAYVLDEKIEGKSKKMMTELTKQLSGEQLVAFTSLLKEKRGQEFSTNELDKLLSDVTGLKSDYFYRNKSENRPLSPLYFINNVKWYDQKGVGSEVESITMNSKRYFSFTQVTRNLGFTTVPISDSQIYLTDGTRSFRLYPGESTFLYNGKAYSIKGELLMELNNKFYIGEEYLLKIFNIMVREKDNELQLVSLN